MTMDSFFFDGLPCAAYGLDSEVVPEEDFELVDFDSADGTKLYGVWAHQPEPGAQVLVYFHGNADNIDYYIDKVGVYWAMGYETFVFDYRGYGMSEGTPDFDGVMADGAAAAAYVADTTGLSHDQIAFLGLSLGGSVAVHTAPDFDPQVLVTEDMFASGQKIMDDGSDLDLPDGWLLADEWDNTIAAAQVTVPYLVIHGDSDTYIEPENAQLVYAAANDPKSLWLVPGADHAEADLVDPEAYRDHVRCWIDQSCPPEE
jgi:hypothetical protein